MPKTIKLTVEDFKDDRPADYLHNLVLEMRKCLSIEGIKIALRLCQIHKKKSAKKVEEIMVNLESVSPLLIRSDEDPLRPIYSVIEKIRNQDNEKLLEFEKYLEEVQEKKI